MPSRTAPPAVIAPRDLESCVDPAGVLELFRKLRYPVETAPTPVPLDEGDLPGSLRDGVAARYPLAEVGGTHPGEALLSVTLFVMRDQAQKSALIRGIAQVWTRRFLGDHLLVFAVQDRTGQGGFEQLTFVNTRRLGTGAEVRIKLHKLIVDRRSPTRHDLDTLNRIVQPPGGLSATQLYEVQCEAFNVERITDAFYREYTLRFRAAQQRIKQDNPAIAAFSDDTRLHTFTQRLFGRVMFLYFLQKKGALNGNHQFIKSWYEEAIRQEENFYRWVLEPLFFETLNRPRKEAQSRFGRVPYLNGGLFAPDDDDLVGEVYLADDLFDTRHPGGLLYFLENHNFTIEEDTPLEVEVALDPEMLGKVFENLLEEEERGQSGTFYTPRPVVAFMCREALAAYLTRTTGLEGERLGWLLDEAETGEPVSGEDGQPHLDTHTLPRPLREQLDRALEQVRVLDPAVGSGAFPLGMLALLVGVRRALYRVAGVSIEQQTPLVEGWKRNFIRDCLYGVDIKHEAIEIARLRLWLSLVVDADDPFEMEPLPNLDFKLMAGDSLIETFQGVTIYPTRPLTQDTDLALEEKTSRQLIGRLRALKAEFFQPTGASSARELRDEIFQTERAIVAEALKEREQRNQERFAYMTKSLGNTLPSPASRAELEALTRDLAATRQAQADFNAGKTLPFFLYRLHFAGVFEEKDGFDIVIANPPYVRHERVPQETLRALKAAYPKVQHSSADLYVYFYARALQLLHEGGTLAFISSNKFFRAGYGKGLRDLLTGQTSMQVLLDLNDAPVFEATTDPCVILTEKGKPAAKHSYRGLAASNSIELEKIHTIFAEESQMIAQAEGIRTPSSNAAIISSLLEKMTSLSVQLGQYVNRKIYRGVLTGLNEAFVVDQATHDRLIAEDSRSTAMLKPFLRGRNIQKYKVKPDNLWLIRVEDGWTWKAMGTKEKPSEAQGWDYFVQRYPAIAAHLAPFAERARARDDQGEFWWELRPCRYYQAFDGPKIIYPVIAISRKFALDKDSYYSNDKTFIIPMEDYYLLGVLNSKCSWSWIKEKCPVLGDPNNRGRFELRDTVLKYLPIPKPTAEQKARIEEPAKKLAEQGVDVPEAAAWEAEIDQIVYQMLDLTPEEIAEVERRAQLGAGRRGQRSTTDEEADA